jgi:hypothetical protein
MKQQASHSIDDGLSANPSPDNSPRNMNPQYLTGGMTDPGLQMEVRDYQHQINAPAHHTINNFNRNQPSDMV